MWTQLWGVCGTLLVSVALVCAEDQIPENPAKPANGFELGQWYLEPWGNEAAGDMVASAGRTLLKVTYKGGEKEKAALRHGTGFSAQPDGKLRLCVYAPDERPPKVAVVLSTGLQQTWHECQAFEPRRGWNAFEVPLTAPNWKTQATEWKFTTGVAQPGDVRAVHVLVLNGKDSGWLAIEGLTADPDETAKKVAELAGGMQSPEADKRAKAEMGLAAAGRSAVGALQRLQVLGSPEVRARAEATLAAIRQGSEGDRNLLAAVAAANQLLKQVRDAQAELRANGRRARDEAAALRKLLDEAKALNDAERKALTETAAALEQLAKELAPEPPKPDAPK